MAFIHSLQSEWIKKRRSAADWLTIIGGLFIPIITIVVRLLHLPKTLMDNASQDAWTVLFTQCWQYMAIFLLPMGIILEASLLAQLEYRSNAWKQVLTTPQTITTLFGAKLSVLLLLLLQFFVVFTGGIYLAGVIPAILVPGVPFPQQDFPWLAFLKDTTTFFVHCLPIVGLQYLLSCHLKNFMIPLGIGLALLVASILALSWKYGYLLPYTYGALRFLATDNKIDPTVNLQAWSVGYFGVFTALNYGFFLVMGHGWRTWVNRVAFFKTPAKIGIGVAFVAAAGLLGVQRITQQSDSGRSPSQQQRISQVEENIGFVKFKIKAKLSTHLRERMHYYGINGLSLAVIDNYRVVWAKGYGWADKESRRHVTTQTLFEPGSISKSLNAIGVMKLYQAKKVDLFQDINHYLTRWKFPYDSVARGKTITLAQLLSHSAGLSVEGFGDEQYIAGQPLPTVVQLLNGTKPALNPPVRSIAEPGLKYRYSGGGTMVSQLVQMDVTRQPYETYMQQTVLRPLGMLTSFFTQPPPADKQPWLATGYTRLNQGEAVTGHYPIQPQLAAAGLWTTPTDLAQMIIGVQQSLAGRPHTILSQEIAELMLTPYRDKRSALGFFVDDKNGTRYFQHGAGNPGFSGKFYGSVAGGNGVVVLVNSDAAPAIFDEIIQAVASAYHWAGFPPAEKPVLKTVIPLPDSILARYVGYYQLSHSVVAVQKKHHSLWYTNQETSWQLHFTQPTSCFNLESRTEKAFFGPPNQVAAGIQLTDEEGTTRKASRVSPITLPTSLARSYEGTYTGSDGETITFVRQGASLWLQADKAIPALNVHFLSRTDFFLGESGRIFSLVLDAGGQPKGIRLAGANTTDLLLTKQNP